MNQTGKILCLPKVSNFDGCEQNTLFPIISTIEGGEMVLFWVYVGDFC